MEIYRKINEARLLIKANPLKKQGRNTFSNYDYFTPEQISHLVNEAVQKVGLFNKFDLLRTELGLIARLTVIDIETSDDVIFQIATEIPEIKATNTAQQLGGAVTYSERYLLMIAYDIKDNNLDFDTPKPEKKPSGKVPASETTKKKETITPEKREVIMKALEEMKPVTIGSLTFISNEAIKDYVVSKYDVPADLMKLMEDKCDLSKMFD